MSSDTALIVLNVWAAASIATTDRFRSGISIVFALAWAIAYWFKVW